MATVWLDRPEARNAMGMDLWQDLPRAMEAVGADPGVRAVVVAAKGPHFSVGLDLKSMGSVLSGGGEVEGAAPAGGGASAAVHGRPGQGRPQGGAAPAGRPSPPWHAAPSR